MQQRIVEALRGIVLPMGVSLGSIFGNLVAILSFSLAAVPHHGAFAATWYVAPSDPTCTPTNIGLGTPSAPFTNLYYAMTHGAIRCGDTVHLLAGEYRLRRSRAYYDKSTSAMRLSNCDRSDATSGPGTGADATILPLIGTVNGQQWFQCDPAKPLIIQNALGADVIFDGTDTLMDSQPGWAACSGTSPNITCCGASGLTMPGNSSQYFCTQQFNVSNGNDAQLWVDPTPSTIGQQLQWWAKNSASTYSNLASDHTVNMGTGTSNAGTFFIVGGGVSGGGIVVRLRDGSNPSAHTVKLSCYQGQCASSLIAATNGAHDIVVRRNPAGGSFRLKFANFPIFAHSSGGTVPHDITFDGLEIMAAGGRQYGQCVRIEEGNNITVKNLLCHDAMAEGVAFYGGGPGKGLDGKNATGTNISGNVVQDSHIYNTGRAFIDSAGYGTSLGQGIIIKNCSNCKVIRNLVHGGLRNSIQVNTSTDCVDGTKECHSDNILIDGNTVYDNCRYRDADTGVYPIKATGGQSDCGGIRTVVLDDMAVGNTINNVTIQNNVVLGKYTWPDLNFTAGAAPKGIHVDINTGGTIKIINNTIRGTLGPALWYASPTPAIIRNNIFIDEGTFRANSCDGFGTCAVFLNVQPVQQNRSHNLFWGPTPKSIMIFSKGIAYFQLSDDPADDNTGKVLPPTVKAWETTSIQLSPPFASNTDLHLTSPLPSSAAGDVIDAPATDAENRPRPSPPTVGAYEPGGVIGDRIAPSAPKGLRFE